MLSDEWTKLIVEFAGLLVGAGGMIATVRLQIKNLTLIVDDIKNEMKKVTEILIVQSRYEERQVNINARINRLDTLVDDLRRGEGYILPLQAKRHTSSGT